MRTTLLAGGMSHTLLAGGMSRTLLAGIAALFLGGCASFNAGITTGMPDVGVAVADANSSVTVTKTVTPDDPATPANESAVSYDVSKPGAATFVFTARPGSMAANITGYRIISEVLNGSETLTAPISAAGLDFYVQSGYTCEPAPSPAQSCTITDATSRPANGTPSNELSVNLAAGLEDTVIATDASATLVSTIVFTGITSGGRPFELPPVQVFSRGSLTGNR